MYMLSLVRYTLTHLGLAFMVSSGFLSFEQSVLKPANLSICWAL